MSLKTKIFMSLSVSILILFSLFSIYTFNETIKTIIGKEQEELKTLSQSIQAQMEGQLKVCEVGALSLANNKEVQKLFYNRDREGLADMLLPAYKSISEKVT